MLTWDSASKQIARGVVVSDLPKIARTALFLPGSGLLCVQQALQAGLITPHTLNIFVERDCNIARRIARQSQQLGFRRALLYSGELSDIDLDTLLPTRTLDYSYLDVCTSLNRSLAHWLKTGFPQHVTKGGTVAITLLRTRRNEKFLDNCIRKFVSDRRITKLMETSHRMLLQAVKVGNTEWNPRPRAFEYVHPRRCNFPEAGQLSPRFHDSSVRLLSMLRILWHGYKFKVDACIEYKRDETSSSGSRMVTFRFTNFRKTSEVFPWARLDLFKEPSD